MNTFLFVVFIFVALLIIAVVVIESVAKPSLKHIIFGVVAIILGLTMGSLLSDPLSKLPGIFGEYLPLAVSIVFAVAALYLYNRLAPVIDTGIDNIRKNFMNLIGTRLPQVTQSTTAAPKLLGGLVIDSSVLIDKRVVEIAKAGFLPQKLIVPRFILKEVQNIADSKDGDRRDKGRRGLEAVEELKKLKGKELEVVSDDFPEIPEVDHKLVALSKKRGAELLTTDYNLNKVASTESVRVLNINELAQGLRPNLLPGEEIEVKLIHLGKDKTQGVGYLEDGTMIVVEGGSRFLDHKVKVKVSRSLQTAAGKMYFSRMVDNGN